MLWHFLFWAILNLNGPDVCRLPFSAKGEREFAPRDQVFNWLVVFITITITGGSSGLHCHCGNDNGNTDAACVMHLVEVRQTLVLQ